ncbi:MAG: hypothetical protein M1827_005456 [Pycnora praestabilis]|nr:MAG: hypothetical protein M1827_005456 [Pycnora praestabilis]
MSGTGGRSGVVVPAQLSFLAIYNPSLGNTDETVHEQVVFYSSKASRARRRQKSNQGGSKHESHEETNEKLRQIGLAQGMVEFARSFSDGQAVDNVETEKSRIVMHELEHGWWILASIDLTRLPSSSTSQRNENAPTATADYSAREVCPSALLLQHLKRAHAIFLLHHASSLGALFARGDRAQFCNTLDRFWSRFAFNWDVLLHGNPAVDIFGGLKLGAGGELGIGVGEEEWGSGEREVLEGFVGRTEGLVDLVVSRFGEPPPEAKDVPQSSIKKAGSVSTLKSAQWEGQGSSPGPSDGVTFSGVGAIARTSLRDISNWMEWVYIHGDNAYGVQDNPSSTSRRKRRKVRQAPADDIANIDESERNTVRASASQNRPTQDRSQSQISQQSKHPDGIPRSLISPAVTVDDRGTKEKNLPTSSDQDADETTSWTETSLKYLTLGYGSVWGGSSTKPPINRRVSDLRQSTDDVMSDGGPPADTPMQHVDPKAEYDVNEEDDFVQKRAKSIGHFVIGLKGDVENEGNTDDEGEAPGDSDRGNRILLRTLHVLMTNPDQLNNDNEASVSDSKGSTDGQNSYSTPRSSANPPSNPFRNLRVVVYLYQPFIFTFLFELRADCLAFSLFYRSLHHQLGPLQQPLLRSTSPVKVAERLADASIPRSTASSTNSQPIYDLVYDPSNRTIHTSMPNIPEPGTAAAEGLDPSLHPWTRIEALNVHTQILNTYISTRQHANELERTCKTSRGWWVVWMRLPPPISSAANEQDDSRTIAYREAFLIRKASDLVSPAAKKSSGRFGRDVSGSGGAAGWGPGKLAEGIGVDTKRYIEGLLSLNR